MNVKSAREDFEKKKFHGEEKVSQKKKNSGVGERGYTKFRIWWMKGGGVLSIQEVVWEIFSFLRLLKNKKSNYQNLLPQHRKSTVRLNSNPKKLKVHPSLQPRLIFRSRPTATQKIKSTPSPSRFAHLSTYLTPS